MNCTGKNCIMQYDKVDPATCPCVPYCPQATPPKTNGDKIRQMTDEELSEMLYESDTMWDSWCNDAVPVDDLKKCMVDDCKVCILKWLKEEVKDGST